MTTTIDYTYINIKNLDDPENGKYTTYFMNV